MGNLREELLKLRTNKQIVYYQIYKDGEIVPETREFAKDLSKLSSEGGVGVLEYVFTDALKSYSYKSDFDYADMKLSAGLVYDAKDIEDGKRIKMNARPYDNIACFKIASISSYLNGEQSNTYDYTETYGFYRILVPYDKAIRELREHGLTVEGPESFEDLKNAILYGQDFDIDISMDLSLDHEKKLTLKK